MKNPAQLIIAVSLILILSGCHYSKSELQEGYYVDGISGNDANSGDAAYPVRTLERLNELLSIRLNDVYMAGGQVYEGTLVIRNKEAARNDAVKIISQGAERAVIYGGNGEAIRIESCKNIIVSGIDLKGSGRKTGNTSNGFALVNSSGCVIKKVSARGFQKSGVDLYDCLGCEVRDVTAADNGFCGINVMGSAVERSGRILIKNCHAENNAGDPSILDNHSGNGILVGVSHRVTIDNCTAANNGWDMPRIGNGPVGIWAWQSDHIVIQNCTSFRNRTSPGAKDGGGFDLDGGVTNSIIRHCLSYENEGAGYGLFQYPGASDWSNNIIRHCISYNDAHTTEGAGSIFIWNGSDEKKQLTGCLITNNIIYNSKAPAISFEAASLHDDFIFRNNIFICDTSFISGTNTGSRFTGNEWHDNTKLFPLSLRLLPAFMIRIREPSAKNVTFGQKGFLR